MSCQIWAVEHRVNAGGLAGAHPGLKNRILLNYTKIENAHKVRKKAFVFFCVYRSPANFYSSFPFSLLRHYQMPEWFYVNNCCFWAHAVPSCYRNWSCNQCGQRMHCRPVARISQQGGQKPDGRAQNQKGGGHIFEIQYWMYAATGEPNVKWVWFQTSISNGGTRHHWPPLATALMRWSEITDKIKTIIVLDKVNYRGTQS